ncbi:hypothetical protein DOC35_19420 [Salmonella enterica subsp. enterica]|nr:hypothetical protein [Salmonella enterica subsp. enterica]
MTTFNAATIQKVRFIAECAHEDCALTTLKNAKEQITNRCKIFAGYESNWQGVDRAEVLECFAQAMDCRTKSDFSRRIELLLETMRNMEIEHEKAEERAKIAAATPRTVEAAPVVSEAEAAQIAFFGGNDYAARRAIVEACHAEALEMEAARQLTARQARFVFHNTAAERAEIIEAAHAEALTINLMVNIQADVIAAPYLPALVEACHAEALAEEREYARAWLALAAFPHFNELTTDQQRRRAIDAAHAEALECNEAYDEYLAEQAAAAAPAVEHVPAANIYDYPIRTLHSAIDAEDGKPYAAKVVTRAYVARSITRALESQQRHAEKYTAQDCLWLAEHNADHAFRNSVITAEEFTELYHMVRAASARPLAILAALRDALLSGAPVMEAAHAAAQA